MSVETAAGYAMAPTDDILALAEQFQPEKALRNGHRTAARASAAAPKQPSHTALHAEAWALWIRDTFGPRWGGSATA